jgi:hypothetical protein
VILHNDNIISTRLHLALAVHGEKAGSEPKLLSQRQWNIETLGGHMAQIETPLGATPESHMQIEPSPDSNLPGHDQGQYMRPAASAISNIRAT